MNTPATELRKVTLRGRGKAHRGLVWPANERHPRGYVVVSCSCPGSQNGSLEKRCVIIAEGWDHANCGH